MAFHPLRKEVRISLSMIQGQITAGHVTPQTVCTHGLPKECRLEEARIEGNDLVMVFSGWPIYTNEPRIDLVTPLIVEIQEL